MLWEQATRLNQATHIAWSLVAVTIYFSTAGRVKQTLTPPSDKTESGISLYSASALWWSQ